jgi:hypothetical protein
MLGRRNTYASWLQDCLTFRLLMFSSHSIVQQIASCYGQVQLAYDGGVSVQRVGQTPLKLQLYKTYLYSQEHCRLTLCQRFSDVETLCFKMMGVCLYGQSCGSGRYISSKLNNL